MKKEDLLKQIDEKYNALGIPVDAMLEGLLHGKPVTYWDYIQTGPLLSLQTQRTTLPDEKVFIMYHQTMMGMAATLERATGHDKLASALRDYCEFFAEQTEIIGAK